MVKTFLGGAMTSQNADVWKLILIIEEAKEFVWVASVLLKCSKSQEDEASENKYVFL